MLLSLSSWLDSLALFESSRVVGRGLGLFSGFYLLDLISLRSCHESLYAWRKGRSSLMRYLRSHEGFLNDLAVVTKSTTEVASLWSLFALACETRESPLLAILKQGSLAGPRNSLDAFGEAEELKEIWEMAFEDTQPDLLIMFRTHVDDK